MYSSLYFIILLKTITILINAESTKPATKIIPTTTSTIHKNSTLAPIVKTENSKNDNKHIDQDDNDKDLNNTKDEIPTDNESTIQESYRALLVFGLISLGCGIYFYYKLKKIREKERVHYGILDDREFELRHLSLTDDEDDNLSGHPTGRKTSRKKKSFLNALNESDDEYTTLYDSRRGTGKKKFTEYV